MERNTQFIPSQPSRSSPRQKAKASLWIIQVSRPFTTLAVPCIRIKLISESTVCRDEIEKRRKRIFHAFWPLALQTTFSIILAAVTLEFVDGGIFDSTSRRLKITQPDGSISHLSYALLQTDVTTAISAGLTAIRFFGGLWTVRRCIFILLEKDGLTRVISNGC